MGRSPCCSKEGIQRGSWTPQEDKILVDYITTHGEGGWKSVPKKAGLNRCGRSCRLRWLNYLRPDIKRGNISADEEDLIIRLHRLLGNRWSLIAGRLPGRTDNEIKNYWNTKLSKKFQQGPIPSIPRNDCNPAKKKKPPENAPENSTGFSPLGCKAVGPTKSNSVEVASAENRHDEPNIGLNHGCPSSEGHQEVEDRKLEKRFMDVSNGEKGCWSSDPVDFEFLVERKEEGDGKNDQHRKMDGDDVNGWLSVMLNESFLSEQETVLEEPMWNEDLVRLSVGSEMGVFVENGCWNNILGWI